MVTSQPTAASASSRHAHTSTPSTSTEHDPHSPCSQAFLAPGRPSRSRRTCSRLSPGVRALDAAGLAVDDELVHGGGHAASVPATGRSAARRPRPQQRPAGEDADRVAAVGRGGPVVVDGAAGGGHAVAELGGHRRVAAGPRRPSRAARRARPRPRGRGPGPGPTDPSAQRTAPARRVDDERAAGDGDDHGVADPDLQELGWARRRPARRTATTSSPGSSAVRFGPVRKSSTGSGAAPGRRRQLDRGAEGDEHGQRVAGGRGGRQVAADRAGVADLRAADRAGRLGQRGQPGGQVGAEQPGVGGARRQHDGLGHDRLVRDGVSRSVRGPDRRGRLAQLGHPPQRQHARRGADGRS